LLENASSWGTYMQKPPPNTLPAFAVRKAPPNSFPSDTVRKAPQYTLPSDDARKLLFKNAMSKQPSLSHSVFPPESESNTGVDVLDEDITIVNDTDPNIIQNDLSAEHPLLQNRKRGAIEDNTEIDKCQHCR